MAAKAPKTQAHDGDVDAFIAASEPESRRADAFALKDLMGRITGEPAVMWGPTIVGFGRYHYRYDSGHEGDMPLVGFSPRKEAISLYVLAEFEGREEIRARLGRIKAGKSCIYVNRLADIDLDVLEEIIRRSIAHLRATYG